MSSREDAPRDHLVVVFLCRLGVHGKRKVAQSYYQSWILLVMTDLASTEGQSCHLLFVEAKMVREPRDLSHVRSFCTFTTFRPACFAGSVVILQYDHDSTPAKIPESPANMLNIRR